ncbi:hypothetical protein Patl1_06726 [Pistacia atlantica]|uniref:Uncharacterized protein n=1 Tax=Pistacia atlantica TaxID=434234 RepID=A0ACC1BSV5_9ROSI|nr:hypothetical protein Patl1_06726 [Pistacia atlantica]
MQSHRIAHRVTLSTSYCCLSLMSGIVTLIMCLEGSYEEKQRLPCMKFRFPRFINRRVQATEMLVFKVVPVLPLQIAQPKNSDSAGTQSKTQKQKKLSKSSLLKASNEVLP